MSRLDRVELFSSSSLKNGFETVLVPILSVRNRYLHGLEGSLGICTRCFDVNGIEVSGLWIGPCLVSIKIQDSVVGTDDVFFRSFWVSLKSSDLRLP